jgi:hypothetical protein
MLGEVAMAVPARSRCQLGWMLIMNWVMSEAATNPWKEEAYVMMLRAFQLPETDPMQTTLLKLASKTFFFKTSMPILRDLWALQMALQIDRCVSSFI